MPHDQAFIYLGNNDETGQLPNLPANWALVYPNLEDSSSPKDMFGLAAAALVVAFWLAMYYKWQLEFYRGAP